MSWLWRLILIIYNLCLMALGAVMIATASSGNLAILNTITHWFEGGWERFWAGAVGGLLFVLGVLVVALILKDENSQAVLVKDAAYGQIFITISAVEQVVLKATRAVPGVRETRPLIRGSRQGLKIYLHVMVAPETVVPELSASLQEAVKSEVELLVGIPVLEVRVLVDDTEARREGK